MRVLVTGSAGFSGRYVVERLLEEIGWSVVTLDRYEMLSENFRVEHFVWDLCYPLTDLMKDQIGEVDAVINLAANYDGSREDPAGNAANNMISTLNLLEWARGQNLKAFIQVSTNEVYAPNKNYDIVEWTPLIPQTPYAASRAAQEMLAIGWWRTFGIPIVIVNTMNLFGEGQIFTRFIPTVLKNLMQDKSVPIYGLKSGSGSGGWYSAVRQWTYVKDFADALHWILTHEVSLSGPGIVRPDRWNIVGTEYSCYNIAEFISTQLGRELSIEWRSIHNSPPGYDLLRYALDKTAFSKFGFSPNYGTIAGLARTVNWFKTQLERVEV